MLVSDIVKRVREVVEVRPDVVYNRPIGRGGCYYDDGVCSDGSIGCIFGQVFIDLKANVADIAEANLAINEAIDYLSIPGNEEDIEWCRRVQNNQDNSLSWAEAVRLADEENSDILDY